MQEDFEEYAEKAKTLPENTTNENRLILYGLYKQATVGPVNTGMLKNQFHSYCRSANIFIIHTSTM